MKVTRTSFLNSLGIKVGEMYKANGVPFWVGQTTTYIKNAGGLLEDVGDGYLFNKEITQILNLTEAEKVIVQNISSSIGCIGRLERDDGLYVCYKHSNRAMELFINDKLFKFIKPGTNISIDVLKEFCK